MKHRFTTRIEIKNKLSEGEMNSNSLAAIFTDIDFILQKVIDIEQLAFQL